MKDSMESKKLILEDDDEMILSSHYDKTKSRVVIGASIISVLLLSYISIILTLNLGTKRTCAELDIPYSAFTRLKSLILVNL
jgi:hypothetical protein